ncbi:MAG: hypothetical protein LBR54_02515 [Oscillospiraceae bacterium]|jgi:hypothetical protein|nr:hypothetical protein [Oscillospiraceae bacterium]
MLKYKNQKKQREKMLCAGGNIFNLPPYTAFSENYLDFLLNLCCGHSLQYGIISKEFTV